MAAAKLHALLEQIHIPAERRFHSVSAAEGEFMFHWVEQHQLRETLEIGLAFAYSAICIMAGHAAGQGTHTCIDAFQECEYQNQGLKNVEAVGFHERLEFVPEYSHHALPNLDQQGRRFDFAFIDAGHRFDQVFLDFYYVDQLLRPGGYVLFHDAWMRSTQMVASFIRRNRRDYTRIRKTERNLILFQKTGQADERDWDHFREFYTLRGFFSHRVVRWLIRSNWANRFFTAR
ncbi:MAG: class I SAM-dependent methyltransferase [Planctomycetota bacterium]|nr:MAG: class I SAM-dependent methyltransferase [Planctomycetota bacterium]REK22601.1 MAG: class I SAM-dependent methyltransferase [Planctomycetota bacterium]REK46607.1 MAG: class I SAM-dependent methyltransferase [Planctomycetota bacterium]